MDAERDFWFQLGYTLEKARQRRGGAGDRDGASVPRKVARRRHRRPASAWGQILPPPAEWPAGEEILASGAVAVAAKVLDVWRPRRKVGVKDLLAGAAAGAAAAAAVELLRPLSQGRAELPSLDAPTLQRVLSGAAQGAVYGTVVEPRLPGPPVLKGAVYGSAEYMVRPAGGISRLLGRRGPLGRLPGLSALLDALAPGERSYVEQLAFGVALAVLYGSSDSRKGTLKDAG